MSLVPARNIGQALNLLKSEQGKRELLWTRIATRHNARPALVNFLLHSANHAARLDIAQAFSSTLL